MMMMNGNDNNDLIDESNDLIRNHEIGVADLPSELCLEILSYLDLYSLLLCRQLNRRWCVLASDASLYRYLIIDDMNGIPSRWSTINTISHSLMIRKPFDEVALNALCRLAGDGLVRLRSRVAASVSLSWFINLASQCGKRGLLEMPFPKWTKEDRKHGMSNTPSSDRRTALVSLFEFAPLLDTVDLRDCDVADDRFFAFAADSNRISRLKKVWLGKTECEQGEELLSIRSMLNESSGCAALSLTDRGLIHMGMITPMLTKLVLHDVSLAGWFLCGLSSSCPALHSLEIGWCRYLGDSFSVDWTRHRRDCTSHEFPIGGCFASHHFPERIIPNIPKITVGKRFKHLKHLTFIEGADPMHSDFILVVEQVRMLRHIIDHCCDSVESLVLFNVSIDFPSINGGIEVVNEPAFHDNVLSILERCIRLHTLELYIPPGPWHIGKHGYMIYIKSLILTASCAPPSLKVFKYVLPEQAASLEEEALRNIQQVQSKLHNDMESRGVECICETESISEEEA